MAIEIKKVAVVGGGTMGRQIALNAAIGGVETYLTDSFPGVLDKVAAWSKEYLNGRVTKGKMDSAAAEAVSKRFHLVPKLDDAVADADLVIEAIVENLDAKKELFAKVEKLAKDSTIIVSNSSTFPPSLMAVALKKPERMANLHYFNPALHMALVEVVVGPQSGKETIDALVAFAGKIGKTPLTVRKEIEGFVVNRILQAITNEAWFLVENGYATYQDIDAGAEKGLGHPMGPFRTLDLAGLDTILDIRTAKYKASGCKEELRPPKLLAELVGKGHCGRKSGQGFYKYDK